MVISEPRTRVVTFGVLASTALFALAACTGGSPAASSSTAAGGMAQGIHKIKHIVVIMQENRSFDSYFGTFPGADGIPMSNGVPAVCVPNPATGGCDRPYHDTADLNHGGPHGATNATADINGGKMNGFVAQAEHATKGCKDPNNPACTTGRTSDVMGYHTGQEIPNYWTYAKDFVLQDHMFEPNASWSLPSHLFLVSEWSAHCTQHGNPASCHNALQNPGSPPKKNGPRHAADLRLDRPNLPAACQSRAVGVLRDERHRAGLRGQRGHDLRGGQAERQNPRHLEPAALFQHGQGRPSGRQHPGPVRVLPGGAGRNAACCLLDRAVRQGQRASAQPGQRGPDLRHRLGQRDHEGSGLVLHRHLPDLG